MECGVFDSDRYTLEGEIRHASGRLKALAYQMPIYPSPATIASFKFLHPSNHPFHPGDSLGNSQTTSPNSFLQPKITEFFPEKKHHSFVQSTQANHDGW